MNKKDKEKIQEDGVAVNNVGGGQIAGTGYSLSDPPINKKNKKKLRAIFKRGQ